MTARATTSLAINASGLVTAVGFNSPASCAAIRAGISGVKKANLWDAESGEYIFAAKVDLPQWWEGLGKLSELVAPAIQECLIAAKPVPPAEIPILLCVAAPDRPHRMVGLDDQLLEEVEYKLGLQHHSASIVIPRGRVSGVVALQEAYRIFQKNEAICCVVAGVDSFLQQNVVEAYLKRRRIMTPNNSNGFFPGEAGTAVLATLSGQNLGDELLIVGCGMGRESGTIDSEDPLTGNGMTQAVRKALYEAGMTIFDTEYRITDLNGEHYKFKEAMFATGRFENKPVDRLFDLWHPIEYIGEIGAAIVPCVLAVALDASQKSYALGDTVLCHFSNDDGERAVVIARFHSGGNF
jgi:3-oxoacyl-[acyl-carrier-protein] synthase-1